MLKPYLNSSRRLWPTLASNNNSTSRLILQLLLNETTSNFTSTTTSLKDVDNNSNNSSWPRIIDCIPPSINEFPRDFFSDDEQRRNGGILLHGLVVAYVCAMLAVVCDRYFVPSLRVICDHFDVPADIAGATFMAVGTSSPELFSSVIGAFVAKSDIGIGTLVGSAVFNILGVTGASGLALGTMAFQLEWYPITRDCFVYIVTVSSLVIVIHDNIVTWFEATCLLLMFVGYITLLLFNDSVHRFAVKMVGRAKGVWNRDNEYRLQSVYHKNKTSVPNERSSLLTVSIDHSKNHKSSHFYTTENGCDLLSESSNSFSDTLDSEINCDQATKQDNRKNSCHLHRSSSTYELAAAASGEFSLLVAPESRCKKILWILMWPANLLFRVTIPSCTSEQNLKWFPLTFLSSIVWLGILSYISFWMVAYIGYTLGIPDTVAGITILAAGTSVPELVASIIVVKNGMANMAVSNLIGSNIFDILFCLGLPWLVKALLNSETRSMVINSSALTYTTLILLFNVVLFYLSLLICKWKLGLRTGITALILYVIFLVLASLYESNVFGDFNPPACI